MKYIAHLCLLSLIVCSAATSAENSVQLRYIDDRNWGFIEVRNGGESEIKVENNIVIQVVAFGADGKKYENDNSNLGVVSEIHRIANDRAVAVAKQVIVPGKSVLAIPVRSFIFGGVETQPFDIKSAQLSKGIKIKGCVVGKFESLENGILGLDIWMPPNFFKLTE